MIVKPLYYEHDHSGVRFLCPNEIKIKQEVPDLFAESRGGRSTIALITDPSDHTWEASQNIQKSPLGVNPMLQSTIVRRGPIDRPYQGDELIVEHLVLATGDRSFLWLVLLRPTIHRIIFEIVDEGGFEEKAEKWNPVVESLSLIL